MMTQFGLLLLLYAAYGRSETVGRFLSQDGRYVQAFDFNLGFLSSVPFASERAESRLGARFGIGYEFNPVPLHFFRMPFKVAWLYSSKGIGIGNTRWKENRFSLEAGGALLFSVSVIQARLYYAQNLARHKHALARFRLQSRAWRILPMDAFGQWVKYAQLIQGRLALNHPGGNPLPPSKFSQQPTMEERNLWLDWIERNSPNMPDGSGAGPADTGKTDSIVSSGG